LTQQTKDEAREETLRRWRALPDHERQTIEQANVFAAALAGDFDFRTMGNTRRVILGWLIRDLEGKPAWGNVPPESVASSAMQVTAVADPETDEMAAAPLVEAELDDEIEQLADDAVDAENEQEEDAAAAALPSPDQPPEGNVDATEASDDDDLEDHRHAAE
jgi:hypothetical protein